MSSKCEMQATHHSCRFYVCLQLLLCCVLGQRLLHLIWFDFDFCANPVSLTSEWLRFPLFQLRWVINIITDFQVLPSTPTTDGVFHMFIPAAFLDKKSEAQTSSHQIISLFVPLRPKYCLSNKITSEGERGKKFEKSIMTAQLFKKLMRITFLK